MALFNIDKISAHIAENPFWEANRYEVIITGPVQFTQPMMFNCSQAGIPGHNIGTFEHSIMGPKRKVPNEELFDDLTLMFYNTEHLDIINNITEWMKMIGGGGTYRIAYYNDIVADINIVIYDLRENKIAEVKFAEAFPVGMAEVEMAYNAEVPGQTTVNFAYHTYEFERQH